MYLSIYFDHAVWAVYFLAFLFALPLPYYLIKTRCSRWFTGTSMSYSILILWLASHQTENLLFAQPVITNLLFFLIFISTLFGDAVPLIGRITQLMKSDVADEVMDYCRWVTWAWACFFLLIALVSGLLSAYASIEDWSLFTNFVVYMLIGLMFIVEFIVRKVLMKDHVDRSFIQFIRDLRQVDYRQLTRQWWL